MTDDQAGLDALTGHLLSREAIVWWGRPQQGLLLTRRDVMLVPFSLFWTGISIFWEAKALQAEQPFPSALFGVPFVLIGLYLIGARFAFDPWLRSRMVYGLTDQRVLIVRLAPWPSFTAINLRRLPDVTLDEGARGRGTIMFGMPPLVPDEQGGWQYESFVTPALDPTPKFLAIDEAQRVFAAIHEQAHCA